MFKRLKNWYNNLEEEFPPIRCPRYGALSRDQAQDVWIKKYGGASVGTKLSPPRNSYDWVDDNWVGDFRYPKTRDRELVFIRVTYDKETKTLVASVIETHLEKPVTKPKIEMESF